jgi:hypothetical protein
MLAPITHLEVDLRVVSTQVVWDNQIKEINNKMPLKDYATFDI